MKTIPAASPAVPANSSLRPAGSVRKFDAVHKASTGAREALAAQRSIGWRRRLAGKPRGGTAMRLRSRAAEIQTWVLIALALGSSALSAATFTPLKPLETLKILRAAEAFDANYLPENLLRPTAPNTSHADYASRGLGTNTFVDFDCGQPVTLAGFEHVQRRTPDTMAEARLVFSDQPDFSQPLATVTVTHVDEPGATTQAGFAPVKARFVRWQVTRVVAGRSPNLGGQSVRFFTAGAAENSASSLVIETRTTPIIRREGDQLRQPFLLTLDYPYAEPQTAQVRLQGQEPREVKLQFGRQRLEYAIAPSTNERRWSVVVESGGTSVAQREVRVAPARELTVYILPHSHTDIGYTALQTDIEEKQVNNLLQGLADARRTAQYPAGARFIWNVEVLWAADLFNQRMSATQREEFLSAVRSGQVALNGMYLNELTGLCRPEELVRLFRYATELGARTGVPIDSAMISDVPGYTWGTVTAMAQAGIRYFSVAPNYFDRIGTILVEWENKPFYWIGPDGQSRVLVWIPFWGYAMSHRYGTMSPRLVDDFCQGLEQRAYPYDIAYVRWSGHGDNAVPDPAICEFVRDWNATHAWPRFVIASTSEAFRAFEQRYGDQIPKVRGDWTPYWEDGAGSSALETAMNRASSERLTQAEALWAMKSPRRYPAARFEEAWNNVLLYSEHTWGAYCSISEPANPFTTDQWILKQSYATLANLQSRQLLSSAALGGTLPSKAAALDPIDIYNTTSWTRSDRVLVPQELSAGANFATDEAGQPVPAQRLAGGELALLVRDLPPFSGRRIQLARQGNGPSAGELRVNGPVIENAFLRARVDETTGAIVELRARGIEGNFVDTNSGHALNDYLYLLGDDVRTVRRNHPVRLSVRDRGPWAVTLRIESEAPGAYRLIRDLRLFAGADYLEILDTVDKQRLEAKNYFAKDGKESVNLAFPFHVPDGEMRLDLPFGVIRPDEDQMPSACKNWFTVGRWVDVANSDYGITWVTLDAPLVQVGGLTANLLNSQTDPRVWLQQVGRSQRLYVWAMNNHWGTNYRAYQEGPTLFRFILRPHRGRTGDAENSRFATAFSQPLVPVPGRGPAPNGSPLLRVEPADVLVTALKPSDDGRAWIIRLFGAGDTAKTARITWAQPGPKSQWLSNTGERRGQPAPDAIEIPARGLVTIRAEFEE